MRTEGEMFVKYYSKVLCRFCWVSFDTYTLNGKHREMAERTDSSRLFQRDGAQECKALAPVLVLTLGSERLIHFFWISVNKMEVWSENKQCVFHETFWRSTNSSWTIFSIYWQPMKGTKQWNTAKEVILSQCEPRDSERIEVWCGQCPWYHTKVNWGNRDDWTQEQLQVILHYPDHGDGEYTTDPVYGNSMSCRVFSRG